MKPTIGRALVSAMVTVGAVAFAPMAAAAEPPAGACTNPDEALPAIKELPWAQRMLDPKSVWRTVRRSMAAIMSRLGARSRFQAGLKAADRGWLAETSR